MRAFSSSTPTPRPSAFSCAPWRRQATVACAPARIQAVLTACLEEKALDLIVLDVGAARAGRARAAPGPAPADSRRTIFSRSWPSAAAPDADSRVKAMQAGAKEYMGRPLDAEEFLARVELASRDPLHEPQTERGQAGAGGAASPAHPRIAREPHGAARAPRPGGRTAGTTPAADIPAGWAGSAA